MLEFPEQSDERAEKEFDDRLKEIYLRKLDGGNYVDTASNNKEDNNRG